jgi:hypothetical protein
MKTIHTDTGNHALGAQTSCLVECSTHSELQRRFRSGCVDYLRRQLAGDYITVLDPFAGVGQDAELFGGGPACNQWIHVNDFDPACLEILRSKFEHVTSYNLGTEAEKLFVGKYDLVYLDYNTFTLHKFDKNGGVFGTGRHKVGYRNITDQAFKVAQKFVIINDCTVHGYRFFPRPSHACYAKILGMPLPNVERLFTALPAYYQKFYPDWHLTNIAHFSCAKPRGNGASSYLLFKKTPQPLEITEIVKV